MQLPGGLWEHELRRRDFAFRPLDGEMELAVADPVPAGLPAQVTAALTAALATLGGGTPTPERVAALCVDDRRFLMYRLALELGLDALWHSPSCPECGARFDLCVEPARVPVKPAADTFPFGEFAAAGGETRPVRVPTGADQEAIAALPPDDARRELLARCVLDGDPVAEADEEALEAALEEVSPEVSRTVTAACPDCRAAVEIPLDPYACLGGGLEDLLDEVDALARAYHWTEDDILALPRSRRQRYLRRAAGSAT